MRPTCVQMEGFSGFREPTTVRFDDVDLVAFVGPTGSGKSSIIDAIVFALYGSVPRYDDRKAIEPAIHKLANEAKVRLDFEVAGCRYTAVRVVRRRPNGGATTREARLYRRESDGTETTVAGTERELSSAVVKLVGLEFDQFTKTCVLPQGAFADLLHADKRERQELLRQLLDVEVYADMGKLARRRSDEASTRAAVTRDDIDASPALSDDEIVALEQRLTAVTSLAERLPAMISALGGFDGELLELDTLQRGLATSSGKLDGIAVPGEVVDLDARLRSADDDLARTGSALADARQRRDAAKRAVDAAPDAVVARHVLDAHEQLATREVELAAAVAGAASAHDAVRVAAAVAESTLAHRTDLDAALRRASHAAGLRGVVAGLVVGEPCPVCRQLVQTVPDHDVDAELAAAESRLAAADAAAKAAAKSHADRLRDADKLDEQVHRLGEICERLRAVLPDGVDSAALRSDIDTADRLAAVYDAELTAVTLAERDEADAKAGRASLGDDESRLRRELSTARDRVIERQPPPVLGASLADDWTALATWAADESARVAGEADDVRKRAVAAEARRGAMIAEIEQECRAVGIAAIGDPRRADVAAAQARATTDAEVKRACEHRAAVTAKRELIEALTERAELHREMGLLLKADGFERWLLQAALDRLVEQATDRLRELSGGQFSLVSIDGDFLVRDHRNADELRSVRTLSGGETFLTSLALALALADDIAELAIEGAPRIESMFLDEGFGTLDPETLDVVAAAIEELSSQGRLIGVVSHIRDLADRMPVRFEVSKDATTSRVLRVEV